MKKIVVIQLIVFILIAAGFYGKAISEEKKKEEPLYNSSLHYTGKGMAYWYDKTNCGLENLTGIPYSNLDCKNCHVTSCDACHRTVINERPAYSKMLARKQDTCLHCHKREASILQIDSAANQKTVKPAMCDMLSVVLTATLRHLLKRESVLQFPFLDGFSS